MDKNLFVFWTSKKEPGKKRKDALRSLENTGLHIIYIESENILDYISKKEIHPAYFYLNDAHKADYLRCYFMHHFGGAYCDVKKVSHSWLPAINDAESKPEVIGVGYREVSPSGVAKIYESSKLLNVNFFNLARNYLLWNYLKLNYHHLIGCGAFYFKKNSHLTNHWWTQLNNRLDFLYQDLKNNPATTPKEKPGDVINGMRTCYPVPWTYLLGDILHPLSYKYRDLILKTLPPPSFKDYE